MDSGGQAQGAAGSGGNRNTSGGSGGSSGAAISGEYSGFNVTINNNGTIQGDTNATGVWITLQTRFLCYNIEYYIMTTEFELIREYRGAFTVEECKFIDFIENFDQA